MDKNKSLERVIENFSKLPSVGKKSAERMAFALLNMSDDELNEFSQSIKDFKKNIHYCEKCGLMIDTKSCPICDNANRDHSLLMVVTNPKDAFTIESSNGYKGLYHVLNGEICLSKGKDATSINVEKLLNRIEQENIKEIILATNPTLDGETTALYVAKLLVNKNVTVTRLAYGLQMGGNIDYTDQLTLLKALEGRRKL